MNTYRVELFLWVLAVAFAIWTVSSGFGWGRVPFIPPFALVTAVVFAVAVRIFADRTRR